MDRNNLIFLSSWLIHSRLEFGLDWSRQVKADVLPCSKFCLHWSWSSNDAHMILSILYCLSAPFSPLSVSWNCLDHSIGQSTDIPPIKLLSMIAQAFKAEISSFYCLGNGGTPKQLDKSFMVNFLPSWSLNTRAQGNVMVDMAGFFPALKTSYACVQPCRPRWTG